MITATVLQTAAPPHWGEELHDLCQPLTRLQWRLEIGQRASDEASLRETVEGSLEDAKELVERVRQMRAQLVGGPGEPQGGQASGRSKDQKKDPDQDLEQDQDVAEVRR